jgi:hypothetical protein
VKIRAIRRVPFVGTVHNLSVEEDESYTAEGLAAHNCRCRKISRSEADVQKLGLTVTSGSDLGGLPDEGWDSSHSTMLDRRTYDFLVIFEAWRRAPDADPPVVEG